MAFKEYKFGSWKKEIRSILNQIAKTKERRRYHEKKIKHHDQKIKFIDEDKMIELNKQLNLYLERAGNDIK